MSIQIFILSKLIEGNNYPYNIKKRLSEPIPFDELSGLTESKLYYHFDSLVKQGLVEAIEIIKEEHRPDKQVFGITEKGRKELPKKIYKLFEKADGINEMLVGIANIKYVEREKVVEILETKRKNYTEHWNHLKSLEQRMSVDASKEKFMGFISGYYTTKADHTIYWLDELIKRITNEEI
ncbi:PadR family transcriptional regulator [Bacillus sp. B1-b2]|uniref:PadR family transcriptional regulator n=1 Tax=Bacillus sp. B1-b2 TaxID=2653201 RepID=UPI001261C416|nr:helix-turn-helix transcriptional regulator [Bacillus sp. B1-b2]KAB7665903.1 PadR family transcriptional regulator [Bacillus sp. B1-b2]